MKKIFSLLLITALIAMVICSFSVSTSAVEVTKILEFDLNDYKNGTVTDTTGHGITLSKVGDGTLEVVGGKNGNAVHFNGAGLGVNKLLMNLGKQYTICTTVRFPMSSGGGRIYGTGIYELGPGFYMGVTPDANWLGCPAANYDEQFMTFSDTAGSQNAKDIFDDKWHSMAMVVDLEEGWVRIYVDGGIENVLPWSNPNCVASDDGSFLTCEANFTSESSQAFALGCGGIGESTYVDFTDCYIQDFAIYNKAFTINEYRTLLGMPTVDGGDENDATVTEKVNVNISYDKYQNAPNNTKMDSIHEVIFGSVNVLQGGADGGGNNTVIKVVAFSLLGLAVLCMTGAVIYTVKTRPKKKEVAENE